MNKTQATLIPAIAEYNDVQKGIIIAFESIRKSMNDYEPTGSSWDQKENRLIQEFAESPWKK